MEQLTNSLLIGLHQQGGNQSTGDFLANMAQILNQNLKSGVVVCYELIPETGGVPRIPPIYSGELLNSKEAVKNLSTARPLGTINYLIRLGEPYFVENSQTWQVPGRTSIEQKGFTQFIKIEAIKSFVFMPIHYQQAKLAALFLNYREHKRFTEHYRQTVEAYSFLIGSHMGQITHQSNILRRSRNRAAVAHTLYSGVAVMYKGQIDALEAEIFKALGEDVSEDLLANLEKAKNAVFEGMRNLVIEASGDLLVDLESMSLSKALNTAAAALRRAWPSGHAVTLDISPVPFVIERQPVKLRQLLYTLILEAIGNSIKHGGPAPYINVDLSWAHNRIYLQVIDHGKGFDLYSHSFSDHGLGFWQSFIVHHLAGSFEVSSQPGFGTVVRAEIPIIPVKAKDHDTRF